ncbi:MAG: glycosyltransferase [Pseudomonadales bacterium]
MTLLERYADVVGSDVIAHLHQLASRLRGAKVVHVNSTRTGGGVAEILAKLVPLMRELDIDADWEVITGENDFFECTKNIHNALQGTHVPLTESQMSTYEKTNLRCAETLRSKLCDADFVFIHDPQPAPLLSYCPERRGKWVWRCHIDASRPYRPVWRYLQQFVVPYDASIFSLAAFSQELPHPQYLIPPSIDPLSEKNIELDENVVREICESHEIDQERPLIVQISRFDRFKDPVGVIEAYQLARHYLPALQLVLAGGSATDDPESAVVLDEVRKAAHDDPDIHVLPLPSNADLEVNALQRAANIVLQKSIREGFGLTVTEALWKGKPVIGGDTGGIRLQVINHHTGFLVNTPEGAALRIRYLLHQPDVMAAMGSKAQTFVRDHFLITRHVREYLTLMVALLHGVEDRIELGQE